MPNEQKYFQSRGRRDHYPSPGEVQSRFRESLKAKQPGANLRLSHLGNFNNESCRVRNLLVAWQKTSNRGNSLHSESVDIVEKNTMHNQRPARLTHLGKNKGFPANQKGSGKKIRDESEKICTPGKSKTWKGGLGKNGYPDGLKTRKGGPGKN